MALYAIQRKSDKKFLPQYRPKSSHNQTWAEFEDHSLLPGELDKRPPRLFTSEAGAQSCLKLWLRGGWVRKKGIKLAHEREVDPENYHVIEVFIVQAPEEETDLPLDQRPLSALS